MPLCKITSVRPSVPLTFDSKFSHIHSDKNGKSQFHARAVMVGWLRKEGEERTLLRRHKTGLTLDSQGSRGYHEYLMGLLNVACTT